MGSIHKRGEWHYIRLYWSKKYYTFSWYNNRRMYDKRDAQKLLAQIQGDIEREVFNPLRYTKGQSPVAQFLWEWHEINSGKWAPGTTHAYKIYISKHLEPFFKESKLVLQEIRKNALDRLRMHLIDKGLSGMTAWHIVCGCLRSCLAYAWECEIIDHMPPFPHKGDFGIRKQSVRYVTPQVQEEILNAIPQEHQPIFRWLALHMRRPAEAMALLKSDYDPERQIFTLRHGISGRKEVGHIKTRDEHELPCHGHFKQILESMKHQHPFSPYLFTCESSKQRGKRYTNEIMQRIWKDACKQVGVDIPLYNGTKHSTAQSYLDSGLSFEQLKIVTGHATMGAVKHYAQAEVEHRRALMEGNKVVPIRNKL